MKTLFFIFALVFFASKPVLAGRKIYTLPVQTLTKIDNSLPSNDIYKFHWSIPVSLSFVNISNTPQTIRVKILSESIDGSLSITNPQILTGWASSIGNNWYSDSLNLLRVSGGDIKEITIPANGSTGHVNFVVNCRLTNNAGMLCTFENPTGGCMASSFLLRQFQKDSNGQVQFAGHETTLNTDGITRSTIRVDERVTKKCTINEGIASGGTPNRVCSQQFLYKARFEIEVVEDKGAVIGGLNMHGSICGLSDAKTQEIKLELNSGRPF